MQVELDKTDRHLLSALQDNARLTSGELAQMAHLSQSPCWRRIQRLKEEGVIRKQVTLLDRKRIGLQRRRPTPATGPNQQRSMDFVHDQMLNG